MFTDDRGRIQRIGEWLADIEGSLLARSDTALDVLPYRLARVRQLCAGLSEAYLKAHPEIAALGLLSLEELASDASRDFEGQARRALEVFGLLSADIPPATPEAPSRVNPLSRCFEIVRTLSALEASLRARGISALYLFGSTARREERPESDVDLAFVVDEEAQSFNLFDQAAIMNDLTAAIGRQTDLVELTSLRGEMLQRVKLDWVPIFT